MKNRDQVQQAGDRVRKRGHLDHLERAIDLAKSAGDLADADAILTMALFAIRAERAGLKPA